MKIKFFFISVTSTDLWGGYSGYKMLSTMLQWLLCNIVPVLNYFNPMRTTGDWAKEIFYHLIYQSKRVYEKNSLHMQVCGATLSKHLSQLAKQVKNMILINQKYC